MEAMKRSGLRFVDVVAQADDVAALSQRVARCWPCGGRGTRRKRRRSSGRRGWGQADMYAADDALDESTAMGSATSRRAAQLRVPTYAVRWVESAAASTKRIVSSGLLTGLRPGTVVDRCG